VGDEEVAVGARDEARPYSRVLADYPHCRCAYLRALNGPTGLYDFSFNDPGELRILISFDKSGRRVPPKAFQMFLIATLTSRLCANLPTPMSIRDRRLCSVNAAIPSTIGQRNTTRFCRACWALM